MRETELIFAVEESPEVGFEARALGHSIFTQAETMPELREMVRDAVRCHFEVKEAREPDQGSSTLLKVSWI